MAFISTGQWKANAVLLHAANSAAPIMMKQRSGRIVCLSSGAREGTPWSAYSVGNSAYSTTKAGVHGFIRDVSLELGEYGIRVNAVAPGPVDTAMAKEVHTPEIRADYHDHIPLNRYGLETELEIGRAHV